MTGVPETFRGFHRGTRAIDLPDSGVPSYFLDTFDRPIRDVAKCERNTTTTITQAMHFLTGETLHSKISSPEGSLDKLVSGGASDDRIIQSFYLAALSRAPDTSEMQTAKRFLSEQPDRHKGLQGIVWALLNSKEFLFDHSERLQCGVDGSCQNRFARDARTQPCGLLPLAGSWPGKDRACILIWLSGGPPQTDLWDMKPDAPVEFRGTFKPIPTNVAGIQISEILPLTAKVADKFAIIRSLTGREGEHEQAMTHMLTGNRPLATLSFPAMGAVVAKEKGMSAAYRLTLRCLLQAMRTGRIPRSCVRAFASGDASLADYRVRDIDLPTDVDWQQISDRRYLVKQMDAIFERNPMLRNADVKGQFRAIDQAYEKAIQLMTSPKAKTAFQVSDEPARLRDRYGRTPLGQGCLLARRLVEAGARFVTVSTGFNQWDTHQKNFTALKDQLVPPFDMAFSALLTDLSDRGLLDSTLVVATGEFGRTPKVNTNAGRDHWAKLWSCAIAGAGIRGGQVYGASDAIASEVKDNPVTVEDFTATIYERLGIDYHKEYDTPVGRPVRLSSGKP